MRYHFETVVRPDGACFKSEEVIGSVVDCIFHVHPELELTWVESSFGVRFVGDNISEFRENDLVLIGSMVPHHYMNLPRDSQGPTWSHLKVMKFGDEFRNLLKFGELSQIQALFEAAQSGISFADATATAVAPLLNEVFRADAPMRLIRMLEVLALLSNSDYTKLSAAGPIELAPEERMSRVLAHVHGCLQEGKPVSLGGTAEVACMTPQSFSRYFRKATRKRFIDYVTEVKIGRACGLLASEHMSVVNVSLAAGFNNLSNFNRHFARLKQMTPREYRRAFRNHQAPRADSSAVSNEA